jgi:hypothetical protein
MEKVKYTHLKGIISNSGGKSTMNSFRFSLSAMQLIALLVTIGLAQRAYCQYSWPIANMNLSHDVSGVLDECRGSRDHFHDGVDIPATQGTAVSAVSSGTAYQGGSGVDTYVLVNNNRWYFHLGIHPFFWTVS